MLFEMLPTIYGKVAQCRRSSALHFYVRALEEEQNGFKGRTVHGSYICRTVISLYFLMPTFVSV